MSNTFSCPLEVASIIDVDKVAGGGVAVADMVQEGWAVWGWELADELLEFCVPGGVRRPGLGPARTARGHWVAPVAPLYLVTLVSPGRFPVVARVWKPALLSTWPDLLSTATLS